MGNLFLTHVRDVTKILDGISPSAHGLFGGGEEMRYIVHPANELTQHYRCHIGKNNPIARSVIL